MPTEQRRRSDRVSLLSPLRVFGTDPRGEAFTDDGRTLLVTHYGAAILLNRDLAPEQLITIRREGSEQEAQARVVGRIEQQTDGSVYGIKFADPDVNFWNIKFPPVQAGVNAVGRLLLQCQGCQARELVYLDELEAEVFSANQCLSRPCPVCATSTIWSEAVVPVPGRRTRNDRRHVRVKVKFSGCIRHPELGEEVVACGDVSRGGFSFTSQTEYAEGAAVEAAVPYSPNQPNIFSPARIVRRQPLDEGGFRYGAAYAT